MEDKRETVERGTAKKTSVKNKSKVRKGKADFVYLPLSRLHSESSPLVFLRALLPALARSSIVLADLRYHLA